jgi:hypothetical protein
MPTGQLRRQVAGTEQSLFAEYDAWCADNKLPTCRPDEQSSELDYARDLTDDARKIDKTAGNCNGSPDFIKRWEKVTRGAGAEHFKNDFPLLENLP